MFSCQVRRTMECNEITDLTKILKENGDKILDATSKLSISTSLLAKMNESFKSMFKSNEIYTSSFHVLPNTDNIIEQFLDLQLLYDFMQKTLALKIYSDDNIFNNDIIDISLFKNLKLLEIHRFSSSVLTGLKNLRSQLEYLTCVRSVSNLKDILENCGGDKVQGFLWNELKEAVFCHNSIDNLDTSLEFVPQLHSIDLSHNCIQNAQYINCLSNLRYLNLGFNQIESVPAFNGQLCETLQVLVLRNNYVDDIKELSVLVNLQELDLSNNCLIEHNQLLPLSYLTNLQRLVLQGNPLSYHPKHRRRTVTYIHINLPSQFILDNARLNKTELRIMGTMNTIENGFDRSSSMNSVTSINTVVPVCNLRNAQNNTADLTSDMDVSAGSSSSNNQSELLNENFWHDTNSQGQEGTVMQDSGFVADSRRLSSSYCSIESTIQDGCLPTQLLVVAEIHNETTNEPSSATSLHSKVETVRNCESDIEILSNPSQSSIEVLSSRSMPRYIQSSSAMLTPIIRDTTSTKKDLMTAAVDMRKSL